MKFLLAIVLSWLLALAIGLIRYRNDIYPFLSGASVGIFLFAIVVVVLFHIERFLQGVREGYATSRHCVCGHALKDHQTTTGWCGRIQCPCQKFDGGIR